MTQPSPGQFPPPEGHPNPGPSPQGPGQFQPTQGQPYGQQHAQGMYGGGEPPKKKPNIRGIISAIILVAVLGFGAFQWYSNHQRDQALTVGQCVQVSGDVDDVDVRAADCDADDSEGVMFYVISTPDASESCADPMVEYYETESRRGGPERTTKTVCLGEVLQVDRCYEDFDGAAALRGVDCPGGYVKVTQVIDEADAQCEADEFPLPYSEWPRTYCLTDQF